MNDLEVIELTLGIDRELAEIVWSLCELVEHDRAVEQYGYPKDNAFPESMKERLARGDYRRRLVACAREEGVDDAIIDALRRVRAEDD